MKSIDLIRVGLIAAKEFGAGINSEIQFVPSDRYDILVMKLKPTPAHVPIVEYDRDRIELKQWASNDGLRLWLGYSKKCDVLAVREEGA